MFRYSSHTLQNARLTSSLRRVLNPSYNPHIYRGLYQIRRTSMAEHHGKDVYKTLTGLPSYTSAQFVGDGVISVLSSVQDHIRNTKRSSSKTIFYTQTPDGSFKSSKSIPQDVSSDVKSSVHSPSGTFNAILRETSSEGEKKRFIEVWSTSNATLEAQLDVTSIHGAFHTSPDFYSLSFSPSEKALVYTAEANAPTAEDTDPYARFRYVPDGGEGMTGLKRPTLFVARWQVDAHQDKRNMVVLPLELPEDQKYITQVIFGQAVFAEDNRVVATGYQYTGNGRRLGTKGCYNRPSAIWEIKFDLASFDKVESKDSKEEKADQKPSSLNVLESAMISDINLSARCPRVQRDGSSNSSTVFWLAHPTGGAHAACSALHSYSLGTRQRTELVPIVSEPDTSFMDGFVGLFLDGTPSRPFLTADGKMYLIAHSAEGAKTNVILIDTREPHNVTHLTRKVTNSEEKDSISWTWTVLGTDGQKNVLCWRSAMNIAPELVLGVLGGTASSPSIEWQVIDKVELPAKLKKAASSLKVTIVPIPGRESVETILVEPTKPQSTGSKRPLVTFVHGGPHGANSTAFNPAIIGLALQGYTVSLPNFTGSLGHGDAFVQKLVGKCGTLDVEDVMASIKHLVKLGVAEEGPGKQLVQGGSHGGFITGHLLRQYPDFFSAAVLRNPVITPEPSSTDIPEWYYYEFGLPFTATTLLTPSDYSKLWPMSPISHVYKVKAPVLLCIGLDDRRVANTHGRAFYHALKGRGKDVQLLEFKGESHPLDGVEAARVCWEAAVDLYEKYRK